MLAPVRRGALPRLAAAAVVVTAALLRLPALGRVPGDPYYDAAVRSMGTSWRAFLFGALEPGGSVAVDKPPVGLWLQVASTKLLGFDRAALVLPEALAGCAAVLALFMLLRRLWGLAEATAGAAALAVLPVSVVTARSDTMDSVAVALALGAALLLVRAARTGGRWPMVAAGAAVGLAFNVKDFQALVPVPALAVLYVAAGEQRLRARLSQLALAGTVAVAVALCWVTVVSLAPANLRPWYLGSSDGSALSAMFQYNGIGRLEAPPGTSRLASPVPLAQRPGAPGPLRLVAADGRLDRWLAPELLPALLAAAAALALAVTARRRTIPRPRLARAGALAFGTWLVSGLVLFSANQDLQVRYLEAFTPAVAATLGVGVVAVARKTRAPVWATIALIAGLLAVPAAQSLAILHSGASDSEPYGAMAPREVAALSRFLLAHDRGARYEVASATAVKVTALVAHDGRPVLILEAQAGRPIVSRARLVSAVRHGHVRYLLMRSRCANRCGPAVNWALRHGHDVTREAGLPGRGVLYALPSPRSASA